MKTIEEKIKYYKDSLDFFSDGMDKYKYLIDQSKKAKEFPEQYRNDTFKVSGCQAQVCLLYTSPSPRDIRRSRMPSSA